MIHRHPRVRFSRRRFWQSVLLCTLLLPALAHAKATTATLSELTMQSDVIVYGHIRPGIDSDSSPATTPLIFAVDQILKGASAVRNDVVALCKSRPNSEWPDLSTVMEDAVLFLRREGDCFVLSHSYRSLVRITSEGASTVAIRGQPQFQQLARLFAQIRKHVSK